MLFQIENKHRNETVLRHIFYSVCDLVRKASYEYRRKNVVFIMHNQKELKLLQYIWACRIWSTQDILESRGSDGTASNIQKKILKMDGRYKLVGEWMMWWMMVIHVLKDQVTSNKGTIILICAPTHTHIF